MTEPVFDPDADPADVLVELVDQLQAACHNTCPACGSLTIDGVTDHTETCAYLGAIVYLDA